ncbi:hypothetical protein GX51_02974 [Blastomyces parvus]|uniref:Uncharacterized protein n=1 Tax=Blastomyces parvus TaxID=2060905 RepID=A0A2B7X9A2_9EURO|nr:hypothetical protein GX51_02974 [Blastomyces parvus]
MPERLQEAAPSTDERIQYLGSAVLLPDSLPDEGQKSSSAGVIGEPVAPPKESRPSKESRDSNGRGTFGALPKEFCSEINRFIEQVRRKDAEKPLNCQLINMRPPHDHEEEWEEAVELGDEPAIVLARSGEYCGYGRYRLVPWVYYPGDPIPDFDLLNSEQIHRLRRKLFLNKDGRPLLRAPPKDEFSPLRRQLGAFIRMFEEMQLELLDPACVTEWDPIRVLINTGPSPNPY